MKSSSFGLLLVVSASLLLAGCGGGTALPSIGTVPVQGTVTYNGAPVAGAAVTFRPKAGDASAFGQTDASGVYRLTTPPSHQGAKPGEYMVTITKVESAGGADVPEDHPDYGKALPESEGPPKSLIPERYGSPNTSELTATVTEGENNIPFELTD